MRVVLLLWPIEGISVGTAFHLAGSSALALVALLVVFPWSDSFPAGSSYSLSETVLAYAALTGMMAAGSCLVTFALFKSILAKRGSRSGCVLVLTLANLGWMLTLVVLFSGPGFTLEIPGTRMQGIFFAEWNFLPFLFVAGGPYSISNGALHVFLRSGT